jgi:hypothetical protein
MEPRRGTKNGFAAPNQKCRGKGLRCDDDWPLDCCRRLALTTEWCRGHAQTVCGTDHTSAVGCSAFWLRIDRNGPNSTRTFSVHHDCTAYRTWIGWMARGMRSRADQKRRHRRCVCLPRRRRDANRKRWRPHIHPACPAYLGGLCECCRICRTLDDDHAPLNATLYIPCVRVRASGQRLT